MIIMVNYIDFAEFKSQIIITGKLRTLTNLHIGGMDNRGNVDSPFIIIKSNNQEIPYIPGSSIKGKIRSLLEYSFGLIKVQRIMYQDPKKQGQVISNEFIKKCNDDELKKLAMLIIELFGESAGNDNENMKITRTIFRDCFITNETRKAVLENRLLLSEEKAENTINRVTSMANPRFMERIPAGVEFDFSYVIRDFIDDEKKIELYKKTIELGLLLLQNDALGGGGSRGNGRIEFDKFSDINIEEEISNRLQEVKELASELY